jgi:Ras family protein T1
LQSSEIAEVKTVVEQKVPEGINSHGLTFPGFMYIHNMFLRKGHPETLWAVLRNFGYDNDLKLKGDFLPVPSKIAPDQVILSSIVMEISQCLPVWLKWKRLE